MRTQSTTLEYRVPEAKEFSFRSPVRILVMGPFTGAWIGFVQTTAAMLCWISYGEPDFYFRGWSGVESHYALMIIGGGLVGVCYGALLWAFEQIFKRRVRLLVGISISSVIAFCTAGVIASIEFHRRRIGWIFGPELIAVASGLIVSVATARKVGKAG